MNKTMYVGIIGTVVLFISGVSVVAAVGHADDVTQLLPNTVAAIQRTIGGVTQQPHENEDSQSSDESDRWAASASTTVNTNSESHELEKRSNASASSVSHREGDDEDNNESESEGDDDRSAQASTQTTPPSASTSVQATASAGTPTFTMAQVAAHASAASCYTTIGGSVYNLTSWIAQHPGGQAAILSLCGINGTAAFTAQHGGQGNPAAELASFKIGTLVQ